MCSGLLKGVLRLSFLMRCKTQSLNLQQANVEGVFCNETAFTPDTNGVHLSKLALSQPRSSLATSMGLCWCDSGTASLSGSPLLSFRDWQVYESTPLAVTAVNRHQSSISSLESISASKHPQLFGSLPSAGSGPSGPLN